MSMNRQILDLFYDFGSPNAYFAREALKDVSKRTNLMVIEHPVLIGGIFKLTNNQPPWMAHAGCAPKMAYMKLEIQRFIEAHKLVNFRFNSAFPVNTLLAMRCAVAAQKAGVHDRFVDPVFTAIWENNKDISQPGVLTETLNKAGLDGDGLVAAAQTSDIKQSLIDATQTAVDRGAFGLPTFFLGDDMYFGKDRVAAVEQRLRPKR